MSSFLEVDVWIHEFLAKNVVFVYTGSLSSIGLYSKPDTFSANAHVDAYQPVSVLC
jgi:hypothetical protein